MPPKKRVVKKKAVRKKRTVKDPFLMKIDYWAIAAKEVFDACRRAGMDEGTALAFAMDRSSYPDWIIDPKAPEVKPWEEDEDDE